MGRPSGNYLRYTSAELTEWLLEAQVRMPTAAARQELARHVHAATDALRRAADVVDPTPRWDRAAPDPNTPEA